jgi:ATP-binding cassette subfamily B protein
LRLFVTIASDRMTHAYFNQSVSQYFSYVLSLPLQFHTDIHSGKLSKILQKGTDNIFWIQLEFFRKIFPEIITIICVIPLVLYFHVKMGIIVIGVGFIIALVATFSIMTA